MEDAKKRIRLKLNTPSEVRKSLTKVCNIVANEEITPQYANAITALCNSILSSIRTDEQDKKIKELQEMLEEIKNK